METNKKELYDRIINCDEPQVCFQCPRKKKRNFFLTRCDCGIVYCIKHRFHDCSLKSKKIELQSLDLKKIDKI